MMIDCSGKLIFIRLIAHLDELCHGGCECNQMLLRVLRRQNDKLRGNLLSHVLNARFGDVAALKRLK